MLTIEKYPLGTEQRMKTVAGAVAAIALIAAFGSVTTGHSQQSKSETQTYTGQITKIDKKNKTLTIKGPPGGLVPQAAPARGRGAGASAPAAVRRGSRGVPGTATPRGGDTRAFEDVETKIIW